MSEEQFYQEMNLRARSNDTFTKREVDEYKRISKKRNAKKNTFSVEGTKKSVSLRS